MTSRNWVAMAAAAALLWPSLAAAGPQEKAMAQNIAQSVKQSGQLSNYRLGVSYNDGVATLSGTVTDASQAKQAVRIAKGVAGVDKVVNKLQVQQQAQPAAFESPKEEKSGGLLMSLREAAKPQGQALPMPAAQQPQLRPTNNTPMPMGQARLQPAAYQQQVQQAQCSGGYASGYAAGGGSGAGGYDNANLPGYAWPSYAASPNYAALTYPKQYSPTAWPYIGPFYPYPQVPLGWRKVTLEWDDGWWFLDFSHHQCQ
ncbi:periplasmic protein [Posidoniimonas corsicana]|uniref:Periplasmic protein n=1 Tax=Posidoniimonas corsicana TaxID=1938618 RepID=A0A5C5VDG5_9BACT|nr:BON domain-containing protein [Posidoniimonas corsicana]TWT36231.1 periplasmic protein [Posidoniimonas corsicana]